MAEMKLKDLKTVVFWVSLPICSNNNPNNASFHDALVTSA